MSKNVFLFQKSPGVNGLTLPIRLLGVDDSCLSQNLGIFVLVITEPAA